MSAKTVKPPEEMFVSPSQDESARFPQDRILRTAGYRIHSRPAHGEPRWVKDGRTFLHSVAWFLVTGREQ